MFYELVSGHPHYSVGRTGRPLFDTEKKEPQGKGNEKAGSSGAFRGWLPYLPLHFSKTHYNLILLIVNLKTSLRSRIIHVGNTPSNSTYNEYPDNIIHKIYFGDRAKMTE